MKYPSIVCFVCVVHLLPRVGKEVHLFLIKVVIFRSHKLIVSTKQSDFRLYFSKNIDWNEKPTETTNICTFSISMDSRMPCRCTANTLASRSILKSFR